MARDPISSRMDASFSTVLGRRSASKPDPTVGLAILHQTYDIQEGAAPHVRGRTNTGERAPARGSPPARPS